MVSSQKRISFSLPIVGISLVCDSKLVRLRSEIVFQILFYVSTRQHEMLQSMVVKSSASNVKNSSTVILSEKLSLHKVKNSSACAQAMIERGIGKRKLRKMDHGWSGYYHEVTRDWSQVSHTGSIQVHHHGSILTPLG